MKNFDDFYKEKETMTDKVKEILEAEGKFDIINNELFTDIKAYLLVKYPSDWWNNEYKGNLEEIRKEIILKFHITEEEYERNDIDDILETHMNNMLDTKNK